MGKVFGIDLGTTYSCITYMNENEQPEVLKNAEGESTTPSVVYYESVDEIQVGSSAKENAIMYPMQVVSLIKRDMGTSVKRTINGIELRPQEISARILEKLVQDATETLREQNKLEPDEEIRDVVITCPAYFGEEERTATKEAGEIAKLNVLSIINEPTAAAICYGVTSGEDKNVLIYDLGGGTFDITIMNVQANGDIRMTATGGDHSLGGADWDDIIRMRIAENFESETDIPKEQLLGDPETLQEISLAVEKAKKLLTAKEKAPIVVNYDGEKVRYELTRDEFEQLTKGKLDRTIELTRDMFAEAAQKGVSMSDISEILLVGGSSRMPQVKARVAEEFGLEPQLYDPDEAVAKGAAIFANNQTIINEIKEKLDKKEIDLINSGEKTVQEVLDENKDKYAGVTEISTISDTLINIVNVSSRSFGVKTTDSRGDKPHDKDNYYLHNMIFKNAELPATETQGYYPVQDNQVGMKLEVYESMTLDVDMELSKGKYLGEALLDLPPGMRSTDEVLVNLVVGEDGTVTITATVQKDGRSVTATFQTENAMSEEELEKAKARTDALRIS